MVIFTACGVAVVVYGFNTAYSRKICHLALFLLPFLLLKALPLSLPVPAAQGTSTLYFEPSPSTCLLRIRCRDGG